MSRRVRILLHWLVELPLNGQSPRGPRFALPARFDHQGDEWENDAWSVVIITEGKPDRKGEQIAVARFLVSDAPHDWLTVGKRFTLFEGKLALAEGVVRGIALR